MNEPADAPQAHPFVFTGSGGEYFRIWIVNLALTILTLGIYSAWAKVRRLQYFYRNTSLAGNSFDYHGDPIAILKGRLIGVALLLAYNGAFFISPFLGILIFFGLLGIFPWLLQRSIAFRLHYSSYRGLRFRFAGTLKDAYKVFLAWPLAGYFTIFALMPMAHQRIKRYLHANSQYGTASFGFEGKPSDFYIIYFKALGMLFGLIFVAILVGGGIAVVEFAGAFKSQDPKEAGKAAGVFFAIFMVFYLAFFMLVGPWFAARIQNLVWNNTNLGPHVFTSQVRARDLFKIYLTNFLLIALTLGLYKPFADVRITRYRLTHMGLNAQSGLEEFLAREQQAVSALGEETADVFDVDISF